MFRLLGRRPLPARGRSASPRRRRSPSRPQVEDMRVDHRGTDVAVTEELLDDADVVVVLEQVGREGVSEGVARGELGNARGTDGVLHRALEDGFVEMMAPPLTGETVHVEPCSGENPLPRPFAPGMRVLPQEGSG